MTQIGWCCFHHYTRLHHYNTTFPTAKTILHFLSRNKSMNIHNTISRKPFEPLSKRSTITVIMMIILRTPKPKCSVIICFSIFQNIDKVKSWMTSWRNNACSDSFTMGMCSKIEVHFGLVCLWMTWKLYECKYINMTDINILIRCIYF